VLYLGVTGDAEALTALRDRIFVPPLARSLTWEFVPHVTVAVDLTPERIRAAISALADYTSDVEVDRVHLLQEGDDRRWQPIADARFSSPVVVGRGGLGVELALTDVLDPEARAFFQTTWAEHLRQSYGPDAVRERPFVITARRDGAVIGTAMGEVRDELLLDRLVVSAACRRQGVASQLLRAVEDLGDARGCPRAVLIVQAGSGAEAFYRARGWVVTYALPSWRNSRDFVRMVRSL
jgi:GNAT superfamily N-acetyltransferase